MQFKSRFRIKQNVAVVLKDKSGNFINLFQPNKLGELFFKKFGYLPKLGIFGEMSPVLTWSNIVTNAGKVAVAGKIGGVGSVADFEYLALGTDNTAASIADTALGAEITTNGGERSLATAALTTTDVANDTLQLDHEWTFTGTLAINEMGVFNALSGPTLLSRIVFPAGTINVSTGMKLHVYWKLDID